MSFLSPTFFFLSKIRGGLTDTETQSQCGGGALLLGMVLFFLLLSVALDLCCCVGFSLVAASRGHSADAVCRLLVAASLVAGHGP